MKKIFDEVIRAVLIIGIVILTMAILFYGYIMMIGYIGHKNNPNPAYLNLPTI